MRGSNDAMQKQYTTNQLSMGANLHTITNCI